MGDLENLRRIALVPGQPVDDAVHRDGPRGRGFLFGQDRHVRHGAQGQDPDLEIDLVEGARDDLSSALPCLAYCSDSLSAGTAARRNPSLQ